MSDRRLKTNVEDLDYGLSDIEKLRTVAYNWKEDPNGQVKLGLIAQEVLEVIPEVVNVGDDANQTLGVRYSNLIPVLIKAIQEQQKIIVQLMADVNGEKSDKEMLKESLNKQMKLSEMHMELMMNLQNENIEIKSDLEDIKTMLGLKASLDGK